MSNIYNIQKDLLNLFETIEENEGEITPEIEEQLTIKQEEFKNKIKDYSSVVNRLELDIKGIKEEKVRLNDLQKSKEHTISKLKDIMVVAINQFGDTSKSGSKFVDYGTGKASIRKSDSIDIDEDGTKQFINKFFSYFNWLRYTNTLDNQEIDCKDIVDYCNKINKEDDDFVKETNYTEDDLANLDAILDCKVNLKDLIVNPKGLNLIRAILDYNINLVTKPSVDKVALKREIKSSGIVPTFAEYVTKDNVIFK